jgi:hypothetical protein
MGKIIIGIHGLGNKPSRKILKGWWKQSIEEGLQKYTNFKGDFRFELVYWADVFYEKPLDPLESDPENPLFLEEIYTPAPSSYISDPHPIRQKILDILEEQLDKIFLNEDLTVNFSFITDNIIRAYFKELDSYYAKECEDEEKTNCRARDIIRQRTANIIKKYKDDEIIIIGHSMGSIIAYDVLTFTIPEVDIHTFVTMGSPLGLPVIRAKIAAESNSKHLDPVGLLTPPSVFNRWINYSDLEDKIALIYDLTDKFVENIHGIHVENIVVDNNYEINSHKNPHKSFGYLRTPEIADHLAGFLKSRKSNFLMQLLAQLRRNIRPVLYKSK